MESWSDLIVISPIFCTPVASFNRHERRDESQVQVSTIATQRTCEPEAGIDGGHRKASGMALCESDLFLFSVHVHLMRKSTLCFLLLLPLFPLINLLHMAQASLIDDHIWIPICNRHWIA